MSEPTTDRTTPLTAEDYARLTRLVQRLKLQEEGWTRTQATYLLFVRWVADGRTSAAEAPHA